MLRVLLVVEQCNPDWASVPLEGYQYYRRLSQFADVELVTHIRNQPALSTRPEHQNVTYIEQSNVLARYYSRANKLTKPGRVNWPLRNALAYPIYAEFDRRVYQQYAARVARGDYDLVHWLTPMLPRYPASLSRSRRNVPFLLGPVNGGVPFPPGFQDVARQEFAQFNVLRAIGRYLIPGYRQTYLSADRILAGSSYTLHLLRQLFPTISDRVQLFYENGIDASTLAPAPQPARGDRVRLLFVGRLVPYKGADMLLAAIAQLVASEGANWRERLRLTIVGDGSERATLEERARQAGIETLVNFTGWVPQEKTVDYYRQADLFCFPSVREFGGAVVLEAMAAGLPCVVLRNGGIGEYVTEATGVRIEPRSRDYAIAQLAAAIAQLADDPQRREAMSAAAIARAREFAWENKAQALVEIYRELTSDV